MSGGRLAIAFPPLDCYCGPALAGMPVTALGIPITFSVGAVLSALGGSSLACIHPRQRHTNQDNAELCRHFRWLKQRLE